MMRGPSRRRRRRQTAVSSPATPYESRSNRFSLAGWLFVGLIIGLIGGLTYSWLISPVVFVDASPAQFSPEFKTVYIEQIGLSYIATGDWETAETRLLTLEDEALSSTVGTVLDEAIRSQKPDRTIRGLAALAQQLGVEDQSVAIFAPTPATAVPTPTSTPETESAAVSPTVTPTATNTAIPTVAPSVTIPATSTTQPNYRLLNQQQICGDEAPQIAVITLDALLDQEPGVEVIISWTNGQDRFFTGFKPENGLGYGDFTMSPDISYTVFLAEGSPEISGIRIETCADGSLAGWELTFQNLRFNPTEE
ncbi:MAG: hypothetical protein AAF490_14970 [Chloroflexota bacterium]